MQIVSELSCVAGVCHFWGSVFGPGPASWQLPLCVVTTWSSRFYQDTHVCTNNWCIFAHADTHCEVDTHTPTNCKQICIIMLLTLPLSLPSQTGSLNTLSVSLPVQTRVCADTLQNYATNIVLHSVCREHECVSPAGKCVVHKLVSFYRHVNEKQIVTERTRSVFYRIIFLKSRTQQQSYA